jgi:hypothetical protein
MVTESSSPSRIYLGFLLHNRHPETGESLNPTELGLYLMACPDLLASKLPRDVAFSRFPLVVQQRILQANGLQKRFELEHWTRLKLLTLNLTEIEQ